jgi:flavin prenyltransferase
MAELVVGVTGASGAVCARTLIKAILTVAAVRRIHLVVSRFASQSIRLELRVGEPGEDGIRRALAGDPCERVQFHSADDMAAPIASGTYPVAGMAIVPCSAGTLGAIATGATANLIHRAADVSLKERRPLVLAIRETPLNRIHLRNLLTVSEAGATVLPLVPSFYNHPESVQDILDQFAGRILDQLGLTHSVGRRWGV